MTGSGKKQDMRKNIKNTEKSNTEKLRDAIERDNHRPIRRHALK